MYSAIIEKTNRLLTRVETAIMLTTGFLLVALTLAASFSRYAIYFSLSWYEEIAVLVYGMLVFWGASNVARDDSHLKLDLLGTKLRTMYQAGHLSHAYYKYYKLIIQSICLITSMCGAYYAAKFSLMSTKITPILGIPGTLTLLLTLFAGFLGLALRYLDMFLTTLRQPSGIKREEEH